MGFLDKEVKIKFVIFLLIGFVLGLGVSYYLGFGSIGTDVQLNNTDRWLTFMSMLSTILATFFIYTGFKIETVKEGLVETKRNVEDALEFGLQVQYAISYLMRKELEKALEVLIILKSEPFVIKDNNRMNTCYFFLASVYLELYKKDEDGESISKAYQFIDLAIEDDIHPLKIEIFEEFEKSQN